MLRSSSMNALAPTRLGVVQLIVLARHILLYNRIEIGREMGAFETFILKST